MSAEPTSGSWKWQCSQISAMSLCDLHREQRRENVCGWAGALAIEVDGGCSAYFYNGGDHHISSRATGGCLYGPTIATGCGYEIKVVGLRGASAVQDTHDHPGPGSYRNGVQLIDCACYSFFNVPFTGKR